MKLTKDTRDLVTIGTVLKVASGELWKVENLGKSRFGINITVRNQYGQPIYWDRLSNWYGVEIVESR